MNNTKEQREKIMQKLEAITKQMTDETIKSASTEELKKYLKLMTEITAKLVILEEIEDE